MNITAIKNVVIFKFLDAVNAKGEFERATTASGIILKSSVDDSAGSPRWATVTHVGPDCTTIKPGQQILIPNLRWTNGFKVDGVFHWKTDESEVAAVRDSAASKISAVNDFILFVHNKPKASFNTHAGLVVMTAASQDTPSGRVLSVGSKVEAEDLDNSLIYYISPNFSNDFAHGSAQLAFVKEEEVVGFIPGA